MAVSSDENDSLRRKKGIAMNLTYTGVPTNEYDNGRDEKPWQRVIYEMTKKGKHLYEPVISVPSALILLLLGWYLLLGYFTQLIEDRMPRVVNEADLPIGTTDQFSEETAWKYLSDILGEEPRVAGTRYHLEKTADVKAMVEGITSRANQHVATDWQNVTGDYHLQMSSPFVNAYVNASNVIAVLEGESGFNANGTTGSSILVNCHYDSVPFAMGASDNAVFCAVMMEVLNKLSKRTKKFKHNLVFLFNGAEENSLQASHGFLKHRWAQGVRSVVNLDSAGMNGKPLVFQVTDPRVIGAYRRAVRRPSAQGLGEFIFGSGIIPSDTDFRVFRDFGDIHGIDIAFSKWGHVYHTRYDHPDLLRPGVIQNAGDTILALMSELGDMDELKDKIEPTTAIYYDYLNWFTVTYSLSAAYGVDIAIVLFALISIAYYIWMVGPRWSTVRELLFSISGRMVAFVAGMVAVFVPASIMIATTTQLRYLSEPWIVVPMFWIPFLIGAVGASHGFDAWRTKKSGLNRSIRAVQAQTATRCIMLVTILVLMCARGMQSTRYLFSVPLFIMSLVSLIELTAIRYVSMTGWQHVLLQTVLALPASMFMLSLALRLDAMLLPVMGRTPSARPDYVVAAANVGLAALAATAVSGVELVFSRRRLWVAGAAVTTACLVIMFVPFSPYRDDGPAVQRHYWFHTEIVTYDGNKQPVEKTTGVAVYKLDAYTERSVLAQLTPQHTVTASRHCDTRVYCDLPLFRTSYGKYLPQALFVDLEGPAPFSPSPSLSANKTCAGETCTYHFLMIGAAHNTITLWPRPGVNITSWSFAAPVAASQYLLERPVYVIVHSLATYQEHARPFEFSVTCTVPLSLQSQTALEVSHHSHKIHHPEDFTEAYKKLINSVPKYFNIATFLTFRHNYVF